MKLKTSKAHGPVGIPGWLLKGNADLLAVRVADILNLIAKVVSHLHGKK